jgi:hypothetical protein
VGGGVVGRGVVGVVGVVGAGVVGAGVVGAGVVGVVGVAPVGAGTLGFGVTDGSASVPRAVTPGSGVRGGVGAGTCTGPTARGSSGGCRGRGIGTPSGRTTPRSSAVADCSSGAGVDSGANQASDPGGTTPMLGISSGPAATNHSPGWSSTDAAGRFSLAVADPPGGALATAVWSRATTAAAVRTPALPPTRGTAGKERRSLRCLRMKSLASRNVRVSIVRCDFRLVQPPKRGDDALSSVRGGRRGADQRKPRHSVTPGDRSFDRSSSGPGQ